MPITAGCQIATVTEERGWDQAGCSELGGGWSPCCVSPPRAQVVGLGEGESLLLLPPACRELSHQDEKYLIVRRFP